MRPPLFSHSGVSKFLHLDAAVAVPLAALVAVRLGGVAALVVVVEPLVLATVATLFVVAVPLGGVTALVVVVVPLVVAFVAAMLVVAVPLVFAPGPLTA